ncbi:MAG TPA: 8-amino-7-oxononanoate synthase, partial [Verrucomicrobia bacterium]|nr:8-amino-7-oxononanoate synthase [Verrucomicrobiota bacterium]
NRRAVMVSKGLERHGIWAPPIRPPTVPVGTARLRLSITLDHSESDLERAAEVIGRVLKRDVEGI